MLCIWCKYRARTKNNLLDSKFVKMGTLNKSNYKYTYLELLYQLSRCKVKMKRTLNIVILTNPLLYQLPVKLKLLIKKLEFTIIVVILTNPLFIISTTHQVKITYQIYNYYSHFN